MDVVVIIPEPGNLNNVAKALLSLAPHPRDVKYVSSPQAGFEVSLELFQKFDGGAPPVEPQEAVEAPKKRGRPKKTTVPDGMDDTSEEE